MEPYSKIEYGGLFINQEEYVLTDLNEVYGRNFFDMKMYDDLRERIIARGYQKENPLKTYDNLVEERKVLVEPSEEKGYVLLEESQKTFVEKPSLEEMIDERKKRIGAVVMKQYIGPETYMEYYHNLYLFINYCHEFFKSLRNIDKQISHYPDLWKKREAMVKEWRSNEYAYDYYCGSDKIRVYLDVTESGQVKVSFCSLYF